MRIKQTILTQFLAFIIALQVFNISLNQNDTLLGKIKNGVVYVNEIETVVEFVAEYIMEAGDVIPETQVPGGSFGFEEEEEKHLQPQVFNLKPGYEPNVLYSDPFAFYHFNVKENIEEIKTPPPRA